MTRARSATLAAVAALAFASGCASMLARPADFSAFRRYRLADSYEARLSTAWAYLRDQPRGAYRREIEAWFVPEERRFFQAAGQSPGSAAAYLRILPDGPHADDERAFLTAWERQQAEEPLRRKRALEAAQRRAEQARRGLGEAIERWTALALSVRQWGEPYERLDAAFAAPFLDDVPPPRCDADRCRKHLAFTYPVPDATSARDRTVVLDVSVELGGGRVQSIELRAAHHGFDWWLEGAEARGVEPINDEMRALAITRAKNRVEEVVRAARPGCVTTDAQGAAASRVIDCGPVWVVVDPTTSGGDDVVRIVGL